MGILLKLKDLLLEAGLDETIVFVYLELLKRPAQTIWELVERTGLSKSTVYRTFENLVALRLVEKNKDNIRALSLKNFVESLYRKERKLWKLANKIKQTAPFLRGHENVERFETLYGADEIAEAYIFMAETPYGVNLDFGDFESFIPHIGGIKIAERFRALRAKHATHTAICTTFGPRTSYFGTKEAEANFNCHIRYLNLNFDKKWLIFSDTSDYVMFNDVTDPECPTAVLIKSKEVADSQRLMFENFSRQIGK